MSSTYAGNSASYPTNITIPSDGDDMDAASVNAAFEGLADRTARLKESSLRGVDFTGAATAAVGALTTVANAALNVAIGDVVMVWMTLHVSPSGGNTINYEFDFTHPDLTSVSPFPENNTSTTEINLTRVFKFTATQTGAYEAAIHVSASAGTVDVHAPGTSVLMQVYRAP